MAGKPRFPSSVRTTGSSRLEYERYYSALRKSAREAGLDGQVNFVGVKSPAHIRSMIDVHDVAFFPSVSESFGKAALECVVSGIPTVLNSAVAAYDEFVKNEKNAMYYSDTAASAADAIVRCVSDEALYRTLSGGGKKTHGMFSWESVVGTLERELRRAVK